MKIKPSNQKGFAPVAIVIMIVLAVVGLLTYQARGKNVVNQKTSAPQNQSFFSKLLGQKPPQPVGMILGAKTTKTLDHKIGAGGLEVTTFSTKDPDIFIAVQVNKPPKGTKFEYVRYFKGKYVDHKSLETTKAGVDYVSFNWSLKTANSKRLPGDYRVKLYTNGNFEKEISFQVR